jgi:preprotein translocase subunit YajC
MYLKDKTFLKLMSSFFILAGVIIFFLIISFEKGEKSYLPSISPLPVLEETDLKWSQEISEIYGRVIKVENDFILVQSYEGPEIKVSISPKTKIIAFHKKEGKLFLRELSFSEIQTGNEVIIFAKKSLVSENEFLAESVRIKNYLEY